MKSAKYIHQISTNFPVHKNKIEPLQRVGPNPYPPMPSCATVPLKYCDRSYTLWEPIYTNWTWEWTAICWSSWWPPGPPWCSSSCPVSPFTMMIPVWHNLTLLDNNKTELKIYCEFGSLTVQCTFMGFFNKENSLMNCVGWKQKKHCSCKQWPRQSLYIFAFSWTYIF